jgi:NADH-quinone oxidoreductase subunit G
MNALAVTNIANVAAPTAQPVVTRVGVVLDSWRELLDAGAMQAGEPYLAATARPVVARISAATASTVGVASGDDIVIASSAGAIVAPVEVVSGMADSVVWLPSNAVDCNPANELAVGVGSPVTLRKAGGAH